MSISDVKKEWPLTVGAYLNGLHLFKKSTITEGFQVYMERSHYFNEMEKLIHTFSLSDLKVYFSFTLVHSRAQWLGKEFFQVWFKLFGQTFNGIQQPGARFWHCKYKVTSYLPNLVGTYFYKKAFSKKQEKNASGMIKLIQEALRQHISQSTWMKPADAQTAINKLNMMLPLIGQSNVTQSYPYTLSRDDYPSNIYTILSHTFDSQLKKIAQPVNRLEWGTSPATVNAFYEPRHNSLIFPAAILQPPFFNGHKVHPARNFGSIGFLMGHEITHGFDTKGRLYDGEGNIRPWWSDMTIAAYENRAQCVKDQYDAFTVFGEHGKIGNVKGDLTLNENIADIGGISLAWDAYRNYMTTVRPWTTLGVTSAQGDKMFFLAFAQTHCSTTRDQTMQVKLRTDPHAPNQWRVNGAVMNSDAFAKVFKCSNTSPMNPIKKCRLW